MTPPYQRLTDAEQLEILSLQHVATAIHTTEQVIIEYANDAMIKIWGKDKSIMGKPLVEAIPELKGQPFIDMLATVWRTGITQQGINTAADLEVDGKLQTFYFDFKYRAILKENGETLCVLHTATDVTERVKQQQFIDASKLREQELIEELSTVNEELTATNEEMLATNEELVESHEALLGLNHKLSENESRFRSLVQHAPVAMCSLKGPELLLDLANNMILDLWGKTDSILGTPFREALPELSNRPFFAILDQVYLSGESYYGYEVKASFKRNNEDEDKYVNFIYHPIKDHRGATESIMIVASDVSEQVRARQELTKITDTLQQAVESASLGIWTADLQTKELNFSEQGRKIHALPGTTALTFSEYDKLIDETQLEEVTKTLYDAVRTGTSFEAEYLIYPQNGNGARWVKSTGKTYYDEEGKPLNISGTILDITERKQDELRKGDFIGMVSHELKTPLTSLKGYVQLLSSRAKKQEDAFSIGALSKVEIQLNKMIAMINSFLNISRLESGKIHLEKARFNLEELVSEIIEESALLTSNHTISFVSCEESIVHADRDKIGQVISNFLSNAEKYSPIGTTIKVACEKVGNTVRVSVQDEGMGIQKEDQEKLFERYYRIQSQQTQLISGFGIGLYLCAEIVQRHDGKIWVESEPEKGSVFYFSLSLA